MSDNQLRSDRELLEAARKGNADAFRCLYEKYWNDLYRIARRRLPSDEDVKDILQETFISFWKNIDHIEVQENLGAYLYTALRNKTFNFYEKQQVKLKTLMQQPFEPVSSESDIYSTLQTKELKLAVLNIVSEMPPKMREIYLLSKEEQLTNSEIAALLSIATQTVKNQVHDALCRIRNGLKRYHLHYASVLVYMLAFASLSSIV